MIPSEDSGDELNSRDQMITAVKLKSNTKVDEGLDIPFEGAKHELSFQSSVEMPTVREEKKVKGLKVDMRT